MMIESAKYKRARARLKLLQQTARQEERNLSGVEWIENRFGITLWEKQREIVRAVQEKDNRYISVRSCHSAGKSFVVSAIVLWVLNTQGPVFIPTTAPTERQVKGILWREIAKLKRAAMVNGKPLPGNLTSLQYKISDDTIAMGFTAREKSTSSFQGFHESTVLIVVDEAAGVVDDIYEGIASLMASGRAKLLLIGNPIIAQGAFYKSFSNSNYKRIKISAFDTPNLKSKGITLEDYRKGTWQEKNALVDDPYPPLINAQWIEDIYNNGEDTPFFRSRILAEFPSKSEYSLMDLAAIDVCQHHEVVKTSPCEIGVDVARFGSDESIILIRFGNVVKILAIFGKADTMETAGRVVMAYEDHPDCELIKVDEIGVGAGVVDRLSELGLPVVAMNAAAKSIEPEKYSNKRAEWFGNLAERIALFELQLPLDDRLSIELSEIQWKPNSRGQIQIELKESIKRRLGGKSPDRADALAMLFGQPSGVDEGSHDIFLTPIATNPIF